MKKTLIALAAVAATGAVFAQSSVTLSGKYGFAYVNKSAFDNTKTSGFQTTDGNVTFAAVEDLGGGLKAGASMDVRVRGRAATGSVDGRDATVYLQGGFGRLTLGSVEAGNGIIGRASAGAPTIGLDNNSATDTGVLDGGSNIDMVQYSIAANGFVGALTLSDSLGAPGAGGMQTGAARAVTLGAGYVSGPIDVFADYTTYKNVATTDNRIRVSGSYNLGVVKLGAGFQIKESPVAGAAKNKQYMVGVSAPVGAALTVGATLAKHDAGGGVSVKGYELGANYAMSKRTNVQVAYQSMDPSAAAAALATVGGANKENTVRVRLMHSF